MATKPHQRCIIAGVSLEYFVNIICTYRQCDIHLIKSNYIILIYSIGHLYKHTHTRKIDQKAARLNLKWSA